VSERRASLTALSVAASRAYHQLYDGTPKILDDPIAPKLVDEALVTRLSGAARPWATQLRLHVVVRSRYAEDRLALAVERGVRQCVILGAGYDTFAYRQPPWARELAIFEVDHPASQREKRSRLDAAGVALPGNVRFAPIDFERTSLAEGLRSGGLDETRPAFFSWLGVMMYLEPDAVDAVFSYVASRPPSSEIAFSFARPPRLFDVGQGPVAAAAFAAGEPWKTRFTPRRLAAKLRALGFAQVELLGVREANERYKPLRSGLPPLLQVSVGSAVVG
jgi:methyltransferase (TIGR00027 family)